MSEDPGRRRLGRGLAALIGEIERPEAKEPAPVPGERRIPLDRIQPNRNNPRRSFADADLAELAQSISQHGLVQPILVRPSGGGVYELIAGERRWRAAQRAGLAEIPAIVREVDDKTSAELAIIENVQRADLNPAEEAAGYQRLIDEFGYTQADLGQIIGKSRSHVANTLRLLKLPDAIREMLVTGALSAGHARTLVTAENPLELANRIVQEGLSVRQAEAEAQKPAAARARTPSPKDPDTIALEKLLSNATGLRVTVHHRGSNGGEMRIVYQNLEQLDEMCRRLQG